VRSVRASGGGAQSAFWRGLLASILKSASGHAADAGGFGIRCRAAGVSGHGRICIVPEVCRVAIRETDSVSGPEEDCAFYESRTTFTGAVPGIEAVYDQIAALQS